MTITNTGTISNFIAGASAESLEGKTMPVVNPATGQDYARAPLSTSVDVDAACKAAAAAFAIWRDTTPGERSLALLRIADALEARAEEFARLEVENTGKPFGLTVSEERRTCVDQIRVCAGAARHLQGLSAGEYMAEHTSMIRREPVGVCGQIIPWNFPMLMVAWKWGPALAAGCTIVDGLEMLLAQAIVQFETWTGLEAPVDAMRSAMATSSSACGSISRPWSLSTAARALRSNSATPR